MIMMHSRRAMAIAVSGLLALAVTGCASASRPSGVAAATTPLPGGAGRAVAVSKNAPALKTVSAAVVTGFGVPEGYGRPVDLTGDTTSSGVWFLAESASDVSVFHWDGTSGALKQYSLGDPSINGLMFGAQSALAVAPDGTVWAGANSTLVHLTPSTSKVDSVKVPAPPDNSSAEELRPPEVRGYHAIESLAVSSSGGVAIAMSAAAGIEEYDPNTDAFSQVALSGNVEPLAVSYDASGTLGVAIADWNNKGDTDAIELIDSSGVSSVPADSLGITASKSGFLAGGSPSQMDVISAGASPSAKASVLSLGAADAAQVGIAAQPLPSGSILLAARQGFDVLAADGSAVASLQLPSFDCSGASVIGNGSGTTPSWNRRCAQAPRSFGVDGAGNVWFTSNAGRQVSEIPAASVPTP